MHRLRWSLALIAALSLALSGCGAKEYKSAEAACNDGHNGVSSVSDANPADVEALCNDGTEFDFEDAVWTEDNDSSSSSSKKKKRKKK